MLKHALYVTDCNICQATKYVTSNKLFVMGNNVSK